MIRVFLLAVALGCGGTLGIALANRMFSRPPPAAHLMLERVQQMATLVTGRLEVTELQTSVLSGATGSLRMVMLAHGEALMGVDLSTARLEDVDTAGRCAVVVLPAPRVISAGLDHQRTVIHSLDATGLWLLLPPSAGRAHLTARCLRDAELEIRGAAQSPQQLEQARRRTEAVIAQLGNQSMRWSLKVRWTD